MTSRSDDSDRLHKLVLLLSSDQPGEVAAAAAAIGRLLTSHGQGWHDLAARLCARSAPPPPPPPSPASPGVVEMLDSIDDRELTKWERGFCASIRDQYRRRGRLSAKQRQHLEKIWRKVA
jgi:hypothetical protein